MSSESSTEERREAVRVVTEEHKDAMRRGRSEGAVVDAYLKAVALPRRRGPKVGVVGMQRRREHMIAAAAEAEGVAKLKLVQQASDLERRIMLVTAKDGSSLRELEAAFVALAADYSDYHGIGYASWREVGVPASVLKSAGIKQTRRR